MGENGGAVSMASGETSFFSRLTSGKNPDPIEIYLSGYNAEYYKADRVGRKEDDIESARLAIIIATQSKALKGIHQRPELVDRGLIARFTFYMAPEITEGDLNDEDPGVQPGLSDYYNALLLRIGLECREDRPVLRLSKDAAWERSVWRNAFKRRHRLRGGDLHDISTHCAKLEDKVIRWAALLHVLWGNNPRNEISVDDFQRALMLVDFDLHHYRLALEHITGGPVYFLAAALKDRLRKWDGETVKIRDLKHVMADFRNADPEVQRLALEDLEAAGLIEIVTVRPGEKGGQPSPSIKVSAWI
jgi:hypothetical protein